MRELSALTLLMILLAGCVSRDKHGNVLDTPTSGSITITADESLKPLLDAEIFAFEAIYPNASITAVYTSEDEAIDALLADSARMAIVTRNLSGQEERNLLDQTLVPQHLTVATGGVALIINPQNPDSLISLDQIKKILTGHSRSQNQSDTILSVPLEVVFDQPNSGIIRFFKDSLVDVDQLPSYCFALKNSAEVIAYVSKKTQAMGLIDVNWISDSDDSVVRGFLNSIKVVGVSRGFGYYKPFQAHIAQRKYPLLRDVIMISREARTGLANGFMAFVASEKGQRIVLKSGLVPAIMPIRIVEINHEPLQTLK